VDAVLDDGEIEAPRLGRQVLAAAAAILGARIAERREDLVRAVEVLQRIDQEVLPGGQESGDTDGAGAHFDDRPGALVRQAQPLQALPQLLRAPLVPLQIESGARGNRLDLARPEASLIALCPLPSAETDHPDLLGSRTRARGASESYSGAAGDHQTG